jgi:UrcA family protein
MTRFLTAPVLSLAAAAALSWAAPALAQTSLAQTSDTVPSVAVKYGDLDVGSTAGAQRLLKRIEAAANTACGGARTAACSTNGPASRHAAVPRSPGLWWQSIHQC